MSIEQPAIKPLPKWIGWLGAITTVASAAYPAYLAGGWKGVGAWGLASLGSILALFSHSATGTGGSPSNP
jgi:formate-dependent nitrite reductase membrane component NrfD